MKRFFLSSMCALAAYTAMGQTLTVNTIEAQAGSLATVVVNLSDATAITALQFCLSLPDGVTLQEGGATVGTATNGHTLSVQKLDSGETLFVLYSEDFNAFGTGEVVRIPVSIGSAANSGEGQLYSVRFSDADAASTGGSDVTFGINVQQGSAKPGDANGDGKIDENDVKITVEYMLGRYPEGFILASADMDGSGDVTIGDVTSIIDIVLRGGVNVGGNSGIDIGTGETPGTADVKRRTPF